MKIKSFHSFIMYYISTNPNSKWSQISEKLQAQVQFLTLYLYSSSSFINSCRIRKKLYNALMLDIQEATSSFMGWI